MPQKGRWSTGELWIKGDWKKVLSGGTLVKAVRGSRLGFAVTGFFFKHEPVSNLCVERSVQCEQK